jgi:hypothetical protein
MGALRQDALADETVGPNITWLDLREAELDAKTYWLTDRQSQCDFDFDFGRRSIRGLNLAAVKHTTVQVTRLLL